MAVAEEVVRLAVERYSQVTATLTAILTIAVIVQRFLGPRADWVEKRRKRFLIGVSELLSATGLDTLGFYVTGHLSAESHACTVKSDIDTVEKLLYQAGYRRNLLAALKIKVGSNSVESDGSWVYRESVTAKKQYHVTLVDTDSGVKIYEHKEFSIIHPIKHYFGTPEPSDMVTSKLKEVAGDVDVVAS